MRRSVVLAGTFLFTTPSVVWADGRQADPDTWWRAWNWDPLVMLSLGLLAGVYCRGLARLWMHVGRSQKVTALRAASYLGALLVIFVALISPLDALSEQLSSLHMVQHMLLMIVAAPLLVIGSPALVLAWGLPEIWSRSTGSLARFLFRLPNVSVLWQPLLLWVLFAATLWAWHHPVLYQIALRDSLTHDAQHLSFFVVACLFWRAGLDPLSSRRIRPLAAVPYFFATSLHASVLGVFLALSPRVWYSDYASRTSAWGLMPLEDQQLAGFIMWMPACLVFPIMAATRLGSWLARAPAMTRNRKRLTGQKAMGV